MFPRIVVVAWLVLLAVPAVWAQPTPLSKLPGYFPFEELDILGRDELSVEINLGKPLLRLVAATMRKGEPEFAALLDNLDAVRVRVAPAEDVDLKRVQSAISEASGWLEEQSWQAMVRIREDGEETSIYTRLIDDEITGMAILVIEDGGDVAVINIVGRIDLAQLEKLGEALDIDVLGRGADTSEVQARPKPPSQEPATDDGQL